MTSTRDGRIFISYRRQDSAYPAGWLYDRLAERFTPDRVFKDVDSIELGEDFVAVITDAVGSCDILLALIGPTWSTMTGADGGRRIDDPRDFVRIEVEAALDRNVLLIPILVDGATMPTAEELPETIAPLTRRQALELSPVRFGADTARLLEVLERTLRGLKAPMARQSRTPRTSREGARSGALRRMVSLPRLAIGLAVAILVGGAIWLRPGSDGDGSSPTSTAAGRAPAKLGGPNAPIVLGIGGGSERYPRQTLPAFVSAAQLGAAVETDVRWTADGVPVLVDGTTTAPDMECTGGDRVIAETSWPELRDDCRSATEAPADGKRYGMVTFDAAVAAIAKTPGAEIYPEVKTVHDDRQTRQFVSILAKYDMGDRAVVTSEDPEELARIPLEGERQGISLRTMLILTDDRVPAFELAAEGWWAVAVRRDIISAKYVRSLNDAEMRVAIWNVNSTDDWVRGDEVAADLVFTDRPAAYGQWAKNYYR